MMISSGGKLHQKNDTFFAEKSCFLDTTPNFESDLYHVSYRIIKIGVVIFDANAVHIIYNFGQYHLTPNPGAKKMLFFIKKLWKNKYLLFLKSRSDSAGPQSFISH